MMRRTAVVLMGFGLCVSVTHAGEAGSPPAHDVYVTGRTAAPPPDTTFTAGSGATLKDDPPPTVEPIDRDEFLGQVQSANSGQALSERIDPFSGSLHLGMVDVVLPGSGGLDIVIQRYYDSGVWNRVDSAILAREAASADMSGRLGDTGWQLHMGKLMNTNPPANTQTVFIMADGSTHPLYNQVNQTAAGEKITSEGWLYEKAGDVHKVTTTTGVTYTFDDSHLGAGYSYLAWGNGEPVPGVNYICAVTTIRNVHRKKRKIVVEGG